MSINETAYDTTACGSYRYNTIVSNLQKASLMGGMNAIEVRLDEHTKPFVMLLMQGGNVAADSVAFFKHPVFLNPASEHDDQEDRLCVDIREFGKWLAPQQTFVVRNGPEYTWSLKRAILNKLWVEGKVNALRDISILPVSVYASLISESIARRFALDPAEQMKIAVLSAFFYYCLFTDNSLSEDELNRTAGNIARATKVPADKVFALLEGVPTLHSLDDLCTIIAQKVGNISLENLNVGTLFAVCCGTWFGTNARENMAVGLEHIPTWLMIVSASLESATYKRSTLTKISMRFDKNNAGNALSRSLEHLLGGKNAIDQPEYATFF